MVKSLVYGLDEETVERKKKRRKLLASFAPFVVNLIPCVALAQPAPPANATWVLIGLDIHMGAVTMRDTTRDADTVSVYGEGLPVFQTQAACRAALHHAIRKYAGRSHAEGNFGRYLCVDWRTLPSSDR
jgi:hypothetical protein